MWLCACIIYNYACTHKYACVLRSFHTSTCTIWSTPGWYPGARPIHLYMNDLPDAIHWSRALLFADDIKCFKYIKSPDDEQSLEHDLQNLASWGVKSHLSFNPSKSIQVSFNQKISISYNIRGNPINTTHSHRDLGVIISDNLNWNIHHDAILAKAYRTLGLVRRTFSSTIPTSAKVKLYILYITC